MNSQSLQECYNRIKKAQDAVHANCDVILENAQTITNESRRVADIAAHADGILTDLDREFEALTGLTPADTALLFTALALQIARQYLLTKFKERKNDKEAAKDVKHGEEEHSNRKHRYYNPTLAQIRDNPVPFDAFNGANGALKGGGKFKHRGSTLGHDPVLGLIFGTANIATSTLTTNKLQSYHITTKNKKDHFRNHADTVLIFEKVGEKLTAEGAEGWKKVGLSLVKEVQHLCTDVYSKDSLPLPFLTLIDGKCGTTLASDLAAYGLDMANVLTVGKQATLSIFINSMIAMLHRMLYNGSTEQEQKLYEVRTRKILKYSNVLAASSNIAVVAATKRLDVLDVGGIGVAIYRLITDTAFIRQVKYEFVYGAFHDMVIGDPLALKPLPSDT